MEATKSDVRGLSCLIPYRKEIPHLHPLVFVADGTRIISDVEIKEKRSVWFNTVVRGDFNYIRIGAYTNIQDNSVLHAKAETAPLYIGSEVKIGHSAVLYRCTIDDCCLIGMGAIILDGFHICRNSIVIAGVPAKIKRSLTEEKKQFLHKSAENYIRYCGYYQS